MSTLDIVLAVVIALYAVAGYRRGLFFTVLSGVGFLLGLGLALAILPEVVTRVVASGQARWRPLVFLVLILIFGTLGAALVGRLGRRVGGRLRRSRARWLDSTLGAVGTAGLMGLVLWLAAGFLRPVTGDAFSAELGRSRVLAAIDQAVPATSGQLVGRAVAGLDQYGFPRVFNALAPEPITPVAAPPGSPGLSVAVRRAGRSVVRIDALALDCGRSQEGSGWVAAPGLVVTNAHVVAGAERVGIVTASGRRLSAEVVHFDPRTDLAVVYVPELDLPALPLGPALEHGDVAAVAGYPGGGPFRIDAARVRGTIDATGDDIYGSEKVTREVYALRVGIHPGNSGGPLLTTAGEVSGVVFARSLDDADTGYALTLPQVRGVLAAASAGHRAPVGTGRCAA